MTIMTYDLHHAHQDLQDLALPHINHLLFKDEIKAISLEVLFSLD